MPVEAQQLDPSEYFLRSFSYSPSPQSNMVPLNGDGSPVSTELFSNASFVVEDISVVGTMNCVTFTSGLCINIDSSWTTYRVGDTIGLRVVRVGTETFAGSLFSDTFLFRPYSVTYSHHTIKDGNNNEYAPCLTPTSIIPHDDVPIMIYNLGANHGISVVDTMGNFFPKSSTELISNNLSFTSIKIGDVFYNLNTTVAIIALFIRTDGKVIQVSGMPKPFIEFVEGIPLSNNIQALFVGTGNSQRSASYFERLSSLESIAAKISILNTDLVSPQFSLYGVMTSGGLELHSSSHRYYKPVTRWED